MARCGRCGTIYNDGARYCPKCGEPERAERGLFRAPRPDSSPGGENDEVTRKRSSDIFAVPLPFAVLVAGILMNPAVTAVDFQDLSARLRSARPRRFFALARRDMAMSYAPSTVRHVRVLRRARLVDAPPQGKPPSALRGGRDFMLTLISFVSTLTNSLSYISSAALKF